MRDQRVRVLVEIGLTVGLAAVLNVMKIWKMPQGGTISFVMLPLIVLALRRGPVVGILAGALYGCVDFLIDPYPPVTFVQPLLDYPIAYALVGASGLFSTAWKRLWAKGERAGATAVVGAAVVLGCVGRYLVHVVSGVVFFAEYTPKGQADLTLLGLTLSAPVVYSMVYNLYVVVSGLLALVVASLVLPAVESAVPSGTRDVA